MPWYECEIYGKRYYTKFKENDAIGHTCADCEVSSTDGCSASCGGDWPNCKSSCPMFDDGFVIFTTSIMVRRHRKGDCLIFRQSPFCFKEVM